MKPPKQNFDESIEKVDDDETLLAVIKRHPFGIIKIYIQAAVGLAGAMALIAFVLPDLVQSDSNTGLYVAMLIGVLVIGAIMLIILMIATVIYYQSKIVVTTKTITQTLQLSLFSKKTSQLAVTSIEDVTSNKKGFFSTVFNFGRLMVETAGEQENFHFDYCPHPDHYAKLILDTRQQFMGYRDDRALYHNTHRMSNYASPHSQNSPQQAGHNSAHNTNQNLNHNQSPVQNQGNNNQYNGPVNNNQQYSQHSQPYPQQPSNQTQDNRPESGHNNGQGSITGN